MHTTTSYARPDDEPTRRTNDETLRSAIRQRPDLLRRLLSSDDAGPALVRRIARAAGLIKEE